MRHSTSIGTAAALALFSSAPCALAAVEILDYELSLLEIPGLAEPASTSRAVNGAGQIVGWYPAGGSATANPLGFIATPDGSGGYTVTRFPASGGPTWVQPYDISDSGVIVGQGRTGSALTRIAFGNSNPSAPLLGTPINESETTGINSSGHMVGWRTLNNAVEAFYHDGNTASALAPFAQGAVRESRALGINDQDQIAGYYVNNTGPSSDYRGFVYDRNTQALTELGLVTVQEPAAVTSWSQTYDAVSINNAGQVAATQLTGENLSHAVLFNGGKVIDLGVVGDYEESFAAGISGTGWVVGFLTDADQVLGKSGFLWASGRMFDLSAPEDYGLLPLPTGWEQITVVHDAYSVRDPNDPLGLTQIGTIVGEGIYLGQSRAFAMQITMQVPEPHTYLMLGFGLLAIGALRMRRVPVR
jgi:hypothetical protein